MTIFLEQRHHDFGYEALVRAGLMRWRLRDPGSVLHVSIRVSLTDRTVLNNTETPLTFLLGPPFGEARSVSQEGVRMTVSTKKRPAGSTSRP